MIHVINLVVTASLFVMMASVGLSVTFGAISRCAKNGWLVARVLLANYVLFPAAAIVLLALFHARPMVAAGFLVLAVCPGAPFGPPLTSVAKGNVAVAVSMMVLLAGSSVIVAPALLHLLLPHLSAGVPLRIDTGKIVVTLLVSQLLPLVAGLSVRQWRPKLAARLERPFEIATRVLVVAALALILLSQYRTLAEIKPRGLLGMSILWLFSLVLGWLSGSSRDGSRTAVAETTAARNVAVGLVIASSSFPGTAALPAVVAYAVVSLLASFLVAAAWGRRERRRAPPIGRTQPAV